MTRLKTSSIQRALLGTLLAASAAIMTTPTAAYSDMVTDWNEIAIQTFPPTVLGPTQARFLGIMHAAIYDAINAIDCKHQVYAIDNQGAAGSIDASGQQRQRRMTLSSSYSPSNNPRLIQRLPSH